MKVSGVVAVACLRSGVQLEVIGSWSGVLLLG